MSAIRIVRATPAELPALEQIERRCFSPVRRGSRRVLRRSLQSAAQRVWFAVDGTGKTRQIAGALVFYEYPKSIRILSVAVLPGFRGCGVGRRLVRYAVAHARRRGVAGVTLEADQRNRRLLLWYHGFGFTTRRILYDYYSEGRHAVRMRLDLNPAPERGEPHERV